MHILLWTKLKGIYHLSAFNLVHISSKILLEFRRNWVDLYKGYTIKSAISLGFLGVDLYTESTCTRVYTVLIMFKPNYLHDMADIVPFSENFTQTLCSQHIPECSLGQQTGGAVGILNVSDWHGCVVNSEVDNSIHGYCHTVFCQNLKEKTIPFHLQIGTHFP